MKDSHYIYILKKRVASSEETDVPLPCFLQKSKDCQDFEIMISHEVMVVWVF